MDCLDVASFQCLGGQILENHLWRDVCPYQMTQGEKEFQSSIDKETILARQFGM